MRGNEAVRLSVVAWIGAEMEFALSQAVALPIPFPQQIPCGRSIIGAVRQKARDRGIELIQEPR